MKPVPPETLRHLASLSDDAKLLLYRLWSRQLEEERARSRIWQLYPDEGPLRRELYVKHLEFYEATLLHDECAFIAANRSGKTTAVGYAAALHMMGRYPRWWPGRRFRRPVTTWLCGEDAKAVRESLQEKMLGKPGQYGTGLVPADSLCDVKARQGVADTVDTFSVRHVSGGKSRAVFKSYEQGRESFQSAAVDVVVMDEEPPLSIYTESLTRTLSTTPGEPNGLVMCSFTPLKGLSEVVLQFLPGGAIPDTLELRRQAWGF